MFHNCVACTVFPLRLYSIIHSCTLGAYHFACMYIMQTTSWTVSIILSHSHYSFHCPLKSLDDVDTLLSSLGLDQTSDLSYSLEEIRYLRSIMTLYLRLHCCCCVSHDSLDYFTVSLWCCVHVCTGSCHGPIATIHCMCTWCTYLYLLVCLLVEVQAWSSKQVGLASVCVESICTSSQVVYTDDWAMEHVGPLSVSPLPQCLVCFLQCLHCVLCPLLLSTYSLRSTCTVGTL